ncbi:FAD-dependent oxidoreductase [Gryllotalpicola daejeonensis]|uniref:FAD-dependent oxidoreductase n=1 Tax=Gryllotalpicola daejeonensis TaxID=993087 RepID=A0ABP7ZJ04_9MICO
MSDTTCVIIGGGPAGMVAGLILARAGVRVTVLEKHADFLRDFRGDTVHPSTLQLLDELGLIDRFLALPHSEVHGLELHAADGGLVRVADFSRLRLARPYIAIAPQWDFLNLLAAAAADEATFELRMQSEVTGLIVEGGRVRGVRYRAPDGDHELRAPLTIAADGRDSLAPRRAKLPVRELPVPFDVWWFRVPTAATITDQVLPISGGGRQFIVIPREGYVQIANPIMKGADASLRALGAEPLCAAIAEALPQLAEGAARLTLDDVKLLNVRVSRLTRWFAHGLLCIGDSAHAMSPVGGVGVNLAVQDGVAAARVLAGPLAAGRVGARELRAIQRRRMLPAAVTQGVQGVLHRVLLPARCATAAASGRLAPCGSPSARCPRSAAFWRG